MNNLGIDVVLTQDPVDILDNFSNWLEYSTECYTKDELLQEWDEFVSSNISNFINMELNNETESK